MAFEGQNNQLNHFSVICTNKNFILSVSTVMGSFSYFKFYSGDKSFFYQIIDNRGLGGTGTPSSLIENFEISSFLSCSVRGANLHLDMKKSS